MSPFICRTVTGQTADGSTRFEYVNLSYVAKADFDETTGVLRVLVEIPEKAKSFEWIELSGEEAKKALKVIQKSL